MSSERESWSEPRVERIDKGAEQRELKAASWEPVERLGKTVWRNPQSGHLYPQGVAIRLVRERAEDEGDSEKPEGAA
jgi:hypothetical protein